VELTAETARAYLVAHGVIGADEVVRAAPLSGGISNNVIRAEWRGGCMVLKQSLERLRVEAEWEFDRARIFRERDFMLALAELLPGCAPRVLLSDEESFLFGMTCAPPGGRVWKDANMAGELDPRMAASAGDLLGRLHRRAQGNGELAHRFADRMPLEQGRLDPYHRTVAAVHPDLAPRIEAEVERLLATRTTLVHGDFSPKNLIAYPDGIFMLDFEVAHWGDPAFDPAFLLSHLVLGSVYHRHLADDFIDEAHRFWDAYRESAGDARGGEQAVVAELGCLLLARIDGKSPIEYLTEETELDAVRRFARALLAADHEQQVDAVLDRSRTISDAVESAGS
jgi:aminoglycoside phosphotransferase (APT) family kinase protein